MITTLENLLAGNVSEKPALKSIELKAVLCTDASINNTVSTKLSQGDKVVLIAKRCFDSRKSGTGHDLILVNNIPYIGDWNDGVI